METVTRCVTTLMVDSVVAVMKDLNSQVTTEHVKVGLHVVSFSVFTLRKFESDNHKHPPMNSFYSSA